MLRYILFITKKHISQLFSENILHFKQSHQISLQFKRECKGQTNRQTPSSSNSPTPKQKTQVTISTSTPSSSSFNFRSSSSSYTSQQINLTVLESLSPPYTTIFIITVILLGLFALLTIFSYHFQLLNTIWVYLLIFLQSIQVVFIELTISCFKQNGWCKGDPKYQLSVIIVFCIFAFVIYMRSHCYCPFYDCSNPLAMNCGRSVLYMFVYSLIVSLATDKLIMSSQNASKQLTFFLTCALYAVCSNPPYISPALARIYSVCCMGLVWTSGVIWATPILQNLFNQTTDNTSAFWFCWGYSYPVVLGLGFVQTSYLTKGYIWKDLFLDCKKKNEDLRCLYLQTTQLIKYMQIVRKSELKSNSAQFKNIWELIKTHNSKCNDLECSLKSLEELRIERGDEMMEQKRFNKTLQKTFQYGLMLLVRQKDILPNNIELSIEIANYELEVFHLRTKGLQLYNREYTKPGMGKQELWGIFYLKKKIEGFDTTGQIRVKGQSQQDISSFKHDIEVSVSMLAEFWYFLSDPKCNLKKLYDLANVLFPMKIKVDKTWKMIRQFKSIECYNLYAKYLIKMFNDKEKGLKILEEAHKLEVQNNEKQEILAGNESSLNQQHGVIFLQFDGKNSGIMYQVNTACQLIFGYNKGELQGRKVNDIMPKVYSIHHDKILEHYQQTNRPKMMNKQRVIWGKSKDGYLFPFTICIKPVRNYYSQTSEVYASVKRDLWIRETAFFFTDSDLNLSDISASLLGIFPNLYGRIHLKKKVPIEEIAPGFQNMKDRVIYQKESFDFTVERVFTVCEGQEYTQKMMLSLTGEQVTVNVSGAIGFYFKLLKNSGASNSYQPNNTSISNNKEANADASNSYWMKRENDFRFIAAVQDAGNELVKKSAMIYHGGLVLENNQTRSLIHSRIQSSFEKTKLQVSQEHEAFQQIDYGKDIKMRRLMGTAIRQIHEISQESDMNNNAGNNDNQEEQNAEMVKPSQLNSILSRQNGNKNINLLKILTIIILCLSTLLSIFQYILTFSNSNSLVSALNTISAENSLQSQIMYINLYSNLYSINKITNNDVTNLKAEINQLDTLSASVANSIDTQLTYSDGSNQSMILSFAIDKLISQAQLLAAASTVSPNDANLFFVQYNSVNGLLQGCQQTLAKQKSALLSTNDSVITTYVVYLAISTSVFLLILIFKNLILRAVLKKKAEILNVFFEIPRYACSSIQKECQRFVQRLTMDDEEEQEFQFDNQVEEEEQSNKRYSKQKKRAIMGEEKTGTTFIMVSLGLLVFLLIYPILVIILAKSSYSDQQYSFQSVTEIMSFEKEMSKMMSFLDTSNSRPNFPLSMNTNSSLVSANHYTLLNKLLVKIEEELFYLGDILSSDYINKYNSLFYNNLCAVNPTSCSSQYGQSHGLNALIFYYFDYMVGKYKLYSTATAQITPNSTIIQKQQTLRSLLKKYWRQFETVLLSGAQDFINTNDPILFGVMLTVCIVNMTVLMYLWIRFYNQLGQKIIATQYILTFIPIDEINKNPKIAKYIKDQVLRAQ